MHSDFFFVFNTYLALGAGNFITPIINCLCLNFNRAIPLQLWPNPLHGTSPMATRVRRSLVELESQYRLGGHHKLPLEKVIRAFYELQKRDPNDTGSWFSLGSWHGEPFRGPGQTDSAWWGGYCAHGNVLFPTWHRTLLLKLEDAMRTVPGCEDVTLPYWDEYVEVPPPPLNGDYSNWNVIPSVLTQKTFPLDGEDIPNPLYSYVLQRALSQEKLEGSNNRYTKHEGYETVRFPLSGLVGTEEDREQTKIYNAAFVYPVNVQILNKNVANWLKGTVIEDDGHGTPVADATSIRKRIRRALHAPNYTVFSNIQSQNQWMKDHDRNRYFLSLESPHNGMHLAVGGFYQKGIYDANPAPYKGANGDMGCNETACFDPIFYLHHCFIDYMFWKWQERKGCTKAGSLSVIEGYPGTIIADEAPVGYPKGSVLDMKSPLFPFRKQFGEYYTSYDVTDISVLGYSYGVGSIDADAEFQHHREPYEKPIAQMKRVYGINRAEYKGSFVIKTFANGPNHPEPVLICAEPILSRWSVEGCANCQTNLKAESIVPIDEEILMLLTGDARSTDGIKYYATIQTYDTEYITEPTPGDGARAPWTPGITDPDEPQRSVPIIGDLYE